MDWEDVAYVVLFGLTVIVLVWVIAQTVNGLNNHYSIQGYWIDDQRYYTVQKPDGEKILLKQVEAIELGDTDER